MLFNSYAFILLFLPLAVIGYFYLARHSSIAANVFLCAMSLLFYVWWKLSFVWILLASMGINYLFGRYLADHAAKHASGTRAKRWLIVGLLFNLCLLGYFKYANFFITNINAISGSEWSILNIALPLGISFFTFTQIAFLVDAWRGRVVALSATNYFLFVTYFPHLLAGPIIHHREMMPQFADAALKKVDWDNIARGLILFTLGLAKKVLIADQIAPWANDGFANTSSLTFADAWITILAYSLQLAFDFSGYTDMALGAALMMNIRLPQNFNAPSRAIDIQDFWRRWHMTLSRFLRDYVYIPLGGNEHGQLRMYGLLMLTFVIGGLWHGAAWTFVLWGVLHGAALILMHLWRKLNIPLPDFMAMAITFLFVIACFAVFRANSLSDALQILQAASGMNGVNWSFNVSAWQSLAAPQWSSLAQTSLIAMFLALMLSFTKKTAHDVATETQLTLSRAILMGLLLLVCLVFVPNATEFIYFIF
jgi:alginate O-acetyltransferase complex protein AlgI